MSADDHVRLRAFGGLRAWHDDVEVALGSVRERILLAELLVARGRAVGADHLIDVLWDDRPPTSARNQLQRHLGQLRRALQPGLAARERGTVVESDGAGYRLRPGLPNDLDELDHLLRSGRQARGEAGTGSADDPAGPDLWRRVLHVCAEIPFADLPTAVQQRPEFRIVAQQRIAAATEALEFALGAGFGGEFLDACELVAVGAPMDEPLHAAVIRALVLEGRQARAAAVLEGLRKRLDAELGVTPSAAVREAYATSHARPPDTSVRPDRSRPPAAAAQLPPVVRGFVDRPDVSARLDAGLSELGSAVGITVLSGMGGIGKTALAVRWARSVADRFTDGQFYLNLRGFDPTDEPVTPMEALTTLLTAWGVRPTTTGSVADRSAQLRTVLEHRNALLLLDNARSSAQIRPLLPGSPGCHVLVTSRSTLPGLVARDGAVPVLVDRLSEPLAVELLRSRLGADLVDPGSPAVQTVTRACAGHPLALSMVAAHVATTARSIDDVAAQLRDEHVLDTLTVGEAGDDLRREFARSVSALPGEAQRVFRLLAVHPGPEISVDEAASIAALTRVAAGRVTRELVTANLLGDAAGGRLAFHDLIAVYARELLVDPGERQDAEQRLVDHMIMTVRHCVPVHGEVVHAPPVRPADALCPVRPTSMAEVSQWYSVHRKTLTAVIRLACQSGRLQEAAWLTLDRWVISEFREPRSDNLTFVLSVLAAVRDLPEPALVAELDQYAGCLLQQLGRLDASRRHLRRALDRYGRDGNLAGYATTLGSMSTEAFCGGDLAGCLEVGRQAVQVARDCGDDRVLAKTLGQRAEMLILARRWDDSHAVATEGLTLHLDDAECRQLRFVLLAARGHAELGAGRLDAARRTAQDALRLAGVMDAGRHLWLLNVLGEACILQGDYADALDAYERWVAVASQLPPEDVFPQGAVEGCFATPYEELLRRASPQWRERLAADGGSGAARNWYRDPTTRVFS